MLARISQKDLANEYHKMISPFLIIHNVHRVRPEGNFPNFLLTTEGVTCSEPQKKLQKRDLSVIESRTVRAPSCCWAARHVWCRKRDPDRSLPIDAALGVGGFPPDASLRFMPVIWRHDTLTLQVSPTRRSSVARQRFIDADHALDPIYGAQTRSGRGQSSRLAAEHANKPLDRQELNSPRNAVDIVVSDSVAALVFHRPNYECDRRSLDERLANAAMSQALPKN